MPAIFPVFCVDLFDPLRNISSHHGQNVVVHLILIHEIGRVFDPGISAVSSLVMPVGIVNLLRSVQGESHKKMIFL